MNIQTLIFDHRHIYINGKIFYLVANRKEALTKKTNTMIVELDGKNNALLNWDEQIHEAKEFIEKGFYILWEIDLGLYQKGFLIEDEMYLQSAKIALTQFSEVVWTQFRPFTLGVSLYRGDIPQFLHRERNTSNLFQMSLLAEYLHLLAPCLPDDVIAMAMLDLSEISSRSELVHLTSKNLFEFFLLAVNGKELNYCLGLETKSSMGCIDLPEDSFQKKEIQDVGVCVPTDPIYKDCDKIFAKLDREGISYRILPERFLSEQWDEIDYMIVMSKELESSTKRMLQGFCAAGGIVVNVGEAIGIKSEISYEEFLENRGRGIRTPDLLVPNQTR